MVVRRRQPGAVSRANTTAGTMRTPPISRTVVVAPSTSVPAATGQRLAGLGHLAGPGRLGQSSSIKPAAIMVSNSTSGMMVCSSWSW